MDGSSSSSEQRHGGGLRKEQRPGLCVSAALPRAARRGRLVGVLMPGVEALRVRWGARVVGDVGERLPVESVEGSAGRSQRWGWGNDAGLAVV